MEAGTVVVHDWWVYLIVTGAGGAVVHEDEPLIYYRQHGQNAIGANDSAKARLRRIAMILEGRFKDWNNVNIEALRRSAHRLTPQNRALLEDFARMRSSRFLQRLRGFPRLGLYRQHVPSTCALWISAMIGRL
jgi:hypothetical protein